MQIRPQLFVCVCVYLAVRHPDSLHLLLSDGVFDAAVPGIVGRVQVNGCYVETEHRRPSALSFTAAAVCHLIYTSKQVSAGLPQFERLLVEFVGAAVGVGSDSLSQDLEAVLAVGVKVDDDGVPVGVVQGVHGLGGDVQQGVLFLGVDGDKRKGWTPLREVTRRDFCQTEILPQSIASLL